MKSKYFIGLISIIALVLFSGCSNYGTKEVKVIDIDNQNALWDKCETSSGALIQCSKSCSSERFQICHLDRYLDGKMRCKC